jgi:hypothetical protein
MWSRLMTFPRLIGALAIVAAIALPTATTAQQNSATATITGRVNTDPAAAYQQSAPRTGAKSTAERRAVPRSNTANTAARTPAASQLATPPSQRSKDNPREASPFDPLKVDKDVSLGLQTSTQLKQYNFDDGRRIPGLENTTRDNPSYFGLSLSAPSDSGTLFPPPLRLPRP